MKVTSPRAFSVSSSLSLIVKKRQQTCLGPARFRQLLPIPPKKTDKPNWTRSYHLYVTGDYVETEQTANNGIKLYLDNRFIISRVFVYAHTQDAHVNMGDVGVLVGDSSVLNEKGLPIFKQCGNTIKVNRQMPNGEQPVLFQAVGSH